MSAVLIVDDEKDICEFLEFRLTHMGHSSLSAHNGVDAFIRNRICSLEWRCICII